MSFETLWRVRMGQGCYGEQLFWCWFIDWCREGLKWYHFWRTALFNHLEAVYLILDLLRGQLWKQFQNNHGVFLRFVFGDCCLDHFPGCSGEAVAHAGTWWEETLCGLKWFSGKISVASTLFGNDPFHKRPVLGEGWGIWPWQSKWKGLSNKLAHCAHHFPFSGELSVSCKVLIWKLLTLKASGHRKTGCGRIVFAHSRLCLVFCSCKMLQFKFELDVVDFWPELALTAFFHGVPIYPYRVGPWL